MSSLVCTLSISSRHIEPEDASDPETGSRRSARSLPVSVAVLYGAHDERVRDVLRMVGGVGGFSQLYSISSCLLHQSGVSQELFLRSLDAGKGVCMGVVRACAPFLSSLFVDDRHGCGWCSP